jgi:hypothetical protein
LLRTEATMRDTLATDPRAVLSSVVAESVQHGYSLHQIAMYGGVSLKFVWRASKGNWPRTSHRRPSRTRAAVARFLDALADSGQPALIDIARSHAHFVSA